MAAARAARIVGWQHGGAHRRRAAPQARGAAASRTLRSVDAAGDPDDVAGVDRHHRRQRDLDLVELAGAAQEHVFLFGAVGEAAGGRYRADDVGAAEIGIGARAPDLAEYIERASADHRDADARIVHQLLLFELS